MLAQFPSEADMPSELLALSSKQTSRGSANQTEHSFPKHGGDLREPYYLASAWESERSKGGRGGDREKDRQ